MRVVSSKVPDEVYEALRKKALERGVSVSAFLRELVERCLGLEVDRKSTKVDSGRLWSTMVDLEERVRSLEERVDVIEEYLKKTRSTGVDYSRPKSTIVDQGKPAVRWLRKQLEDPERYFKAVARREGDEVLWVEKEPGTYCYALKGKIEALVQDANTKGTGPDEASEELRELQLCGLVYYSNGEWKTIE